MVRDPGHIWKELAFDRTVALGVRITRVIGKERCMQMQIKEEIKEIPGLRF